MQKETGRYGFQTEVIKDLECLFPGCVILKNDPTYIQGIPDLLLLYRTKWAALETKRSRTAHIRPNQEFYVSKLNDMSFASFICPDNKQEVLYELQLAFGTRRKTRLS